MIINYFSKNVLVKSKKVDIDNLSRNINILKCYQGEHANYIINLFNYYNAFLTKNAPDIVKSLSQVYGDSFFNSEANEQGLLNSNITISPSHDNTYYLIKNLNFKKKPLTIICMDMHSDTYDSSVPLWKGNVFSKLLKENYINNIIVIGVPDYKISLTKKSIDPNIKKNVYILNSKSNLINVLKLIKPFRIFFSIDLDVFDSFGNKYTAIEYSPYSILNHLSHSYLGEGENIMPIVEESIYVPNLDGYKNLYKVGENYLTLSSIRSIVLKVYFFCSKNKIKFGYVSNGFNIVADISEAYGYDYGRLTTDLITNIINIIKEVTKE